MRRHAVVAVLVVLVGGMVGTSASGAASSVPLAQLVLHRAEVPQGFTGTGRYYTNAQYASYLKETTADIQSTGQLLTYEEKLYNNKAATITEIDIQIFLYRSVSDAQMNVDAWNGANRGGRRFSASGIGTASYGYRTTPTYSSTMVTEDKLAFQCGPYEVDMIVDGALGSYSPGRIIAWAHHIDARIARVLASGRGAASLTQSQPAVRAG